VYIYIYIYIYVTKQMLHAHSYMHSHIHACVSEAYQLDVYPNIIKSIHILHTCICINPYTHTYIHTYTHTHIHTYIPKFTYIYMYMCRGAVWRAHMGFFLRGSARNGVGSRCTGLEKSIQNACSSCKRIGAAAGCVVLEMMSSLLKSKGDDQ
jgi:hypothetical protein